ncbi:HD domain-containing protein [Candidatus Pelagibacter sp.]|nr:HD domain-containing protein [Candidatus Pelagibacter sp.]
MKKVCFTKMKDGTKEEYLFLDKLEKEFISETGERIIKYLKQYDETIEGYQVSRLEHSLQAATRAFKDKASDEMVVATLLHDIGDDLAPANHAEYAAAILKPYISEKTYWILLKHGEFQMYYYAHHLGADKNKREKYKDHKYYEDCIKFCELWDQSSFDPNYKSFKLEFFEPLIRKIFLRKPYTS